MFRSVRGIVTGAVLAASLAACGSGGGSGGDTGNGADQGGGDQQKAPLVLAADQVRTALVSKSSAPEGWKGRSPKFLSPNDALRKCQDTTETNCGGFVSYGNTDFLKEKQNAEGRTGHLYFTLFSFKTPEDAQAAMKGLTKRERHKAGADAKPLQISAGAEATDAFTGKHTEVHMRLGGVLIRLESTDLTDSEPYADFAKLQIDRIKKVAEGKNPDA
ncbi:Lipoprotein OS=Streptomyces rimosus subsp. rimosus (strain ATCC / DSM 40260 / JCM 4667 / NRRL 2234) OX=1265868 GN=SRIM_026285 PE=4 SV=1 [Streptomyces rimosus subsp. rimosus]